MTDQEMRFLEKLGITPGPWTHTETGFIGDRKGNALLQSWDKFEIDFDNAENNQKFAAKAPEMFLSLFKTAYTITGGNLPKNKEVLKRLDEIKEIIEKITGFENMQISRFVKIWESCA